MTQQDYSKTPMQSFGTQVLSDEAVLKKIQKALPNSSDYDDGLSRLAKTKQAEQTN